MRTPATGRMPGEEGACPACGGAQFEGRFPAPGPAAGIRRCRGCGLTAAVGAFDHDLSALDRLNFRQWYGGRPLSWSAEDYEKYRPSCTQQIALLERYARPGNLLDLGCGTGYLLKVAQERGWRGTGTELIADCVRFVVDILKADCVHTSIETAAFAPGAFDAIALRQVLEHTRDPRAVLGQCRTWLAPGGLLLLLLPNEDAIDLALLNTVSSLCGGGKKYTTVSPPIHFWGFTPRSLRLMLAHAGFSVLLARGFWEGDPMLHPNLGLARPIRSRKDLQWNVQLMLKLSLLRPAGELTGRCSQLMVLARRSIP
ncbi:MAG TPA: class I SAM-dependent methyltransferase [Candidatus Edwardsbacteria bacterium]|nr:class I SAM-dependent methyltransferase [Candidatus Edwardsbacteria bacterium]